MRVRKRRLSATCFTVLLFVSIIMGRTMFTSMAKEEGSRTTPYYKSVRIQEGDSLWVFLVKHQRIADEQYRLDNYQANN